MYAKNIDFSRLQIGLQLSKSLILISSSSKTGYSDNILSDHLLMMVNGQLRISLLNDEVDQSIFLLILFKIYSPYLVKKIMYTYFR